MDKETALKAFMQRCFDQRLPVYLVCQRAGVSRNTPSRWKARPETIRPATLRKLEDALDWFEKTPTVCGTCFRNSTDPETWGCALYGCGLNLTRKQA